MVTGFILKADADSMQARRIIFTIFEYIPFIGKELAYSLFGPEKDFQLIYVHHIATTSIFIIIVYYIKLAVPKVCLSICIVN